MTRALRPEGFNIGFNLGHAVAGGSIAHLHAHIVPRWNGDNNFMPVLADTRILPQALEETWARLAAKAEGDREKAAAKADIQQEAARAREQLRDQVAALAVAGEVASNQMVDNDNDGLWTAMYAAAECFRFAVTKSPEALANAKKSVEAVLFLEEVAGKRGFPARSYVRKGDRMPRGGEWQIQKSRFRN